jgi:hypothetical protein
MRLFQSPWKRGFFSCRLQSARVVARTRQWEHVFVTAQGHARTHFRRAIERKNLMGAETALREMGAVDLLAALDYVALLAELRPARARRAAVRWHGRLETETPMLTMPDSALALAALVALCSGDREALGLLRRLVRRVTPTGNLRPS